MSEEKFVEEKSILLRKTIWDRFDKIERMLLSLARSQDNEEVLYTTTHTEDMMEAMKDTNE